MRSIAIVLKRKELLHDIELDAFIIGDALRTNVEKDKSTIQDVAKDDRARKIMREIENAKSRLVSLLSAYNKQPMRHDAAIVDRLDDRDTITIMLSVPDTFNVVNLEHIKNLMHSFIVNKSLSSWFRLTSPDRVQQYEIDAMDNLSDIKLNMSYRAERIKRKMHPF